MFLTVMAILALIIMLVLKVFHIGQPQAKKALKSVVVSCLPACIDQVAALAARSV